MPRGASPLGVWTQPPIATRTTTIVKSLNYYSGAIACAASFSGNKDVTITAVTAAKSWIIGARTGANFGSGSQITYARVSVDTSTTVRFHSVVNADSGNPHDLDYAFWVIEVY